MLNVKLLGYSIQKYSKYVWLRTSCHGIPPGMAGPSDTCDRSSRLHGIGCIFESVALAESLFHLSEVTKFEVPAGTGGMRHEGEVERSKSCPRCIQHTQQVSLRWNGLPPISCPGRIHRYPQAVWGSLRQSEATVSTVLGVNEPRTGNRFRVASVCRMRFCKSFTQWPAIQIPQTFSVNHETMWIIVDPCRSIQNLQNSLVAFLRHFCQKTKIQLVAFTLAWRSSTSHP